MSKKAIPVAQSSGGAGHFSNVRGGVFRLLDGKDIPLVGLGTYALYSQKEVDVAVDAALANGYRLFDTANFYRNERELGQAFKKLLPKHGVTRSDIYIITKANISGRPKVAESARQKLNHSLECFAPLCGGPNERGYIDLALIHYPKDWSASDKSTSNRRERLETYRVLEEYRSVGRCHSIGVSNFEPHHIDELMEDGAGQLPTVNQCEYHPHLTRAELVAYCRAKGILFQAHTSLAKHSRSLYGEPVLKAVAEKHKASVQQVLLSFAHRQGISIIPKSGNPTRIAENMRAVEVELSEAELQQLLALNKDKHYSDCDGWNVL